MGIALKVFLFGLAVDVIFLNLLWMLRPVWKFLKRNIFVKSVKLPDVEPKYDKEGFVQFCYNMLPRGKRIENAEAELVMLDGKIEKLAKKLRKTQAELKREHTEAELVALENLCKTLMEELQNAQIQLSHSRARLNDLRNHKDDMEPDLRTREQALNDFEQIKAMRGVHQVFVHDDTLRLYVRASCEYKGFVYDLGDYEVSICFDDVFMAKKARRARGGYGFYSFCFGDRYYDIARYIDSGRLVEAVELIIECLNHINVRDRRMIPENYDKIRKLSKKEMQG